MTQEVIATVVGELDWAPERCTVGGVLHGGTLMTLADSVGAVCAFLSLPAGATGTSTIASKTNLVGHPDPCGAGRLTAASRSRSCRRRIRRGCDP